MQEYKFNRTLDNISERRLIGELFCRFKALVRISSIDWAHSRRRMTSEESEMVGKFDCGKTPHLEYVYDCLDNWQIYIVVAMKASQIGWSELTNNFIGKIIETSPCKMMMAFPGMTLCRAYSREKLKVLIDTTKPLRDIVNLGVLKESFNFFKFPGGWLKLTTLGSIQSVLSSSLKLIIIEEPSQVKHEIANQGDWLQLCIGRQKTFNIGQKKIIFGGTPTHKDFCKVDAAYAKSNQLVFKAQCHGCKELVELSLDNLHYFEYSHRYMDEIYGKYDPETAYYSCPRCSLNWTFEEKTNNIIAGKAFGFTDFTGNFSKGWHSKKPEITEIFGFHIPELLSSFSDTTNYVSLAKKKILSELALAKGDESLIKDLKNNTEGLPYASGITAIEAIEMKTFRKNYPAGIVPMEALKLTCGIDVQENRVAPVIRGWGRNNNSWLVEWKEIFGDFTLQDFNANGEPVGAWGELFKYVIQGIPHASGKLMYIDGISIDSGDNTELVYKFVIAVAEYFVREKRGRMVFATKGTRDLRFSQDEIYRDPASREINVTSNNARISMAERMGVPLYFLGAHRAHEEILRRVALNKNNDARSNLYFHNEQPYGMYEEQMTSCRKLIDVDSSYGKTVFKLIPGKRKEAMDAEKNALHASYALGIRNYTPAHWEALEKYYYS
jgi:phage terminase large subunit GpA-like protein